MEESREERLGFVGWSELERVLKAVLIVCAVGLSALTCFLAAIPMFPAGARPGGNDAAAIATLKNLAIEQQRFRDNASLDRNGDGDGEFGFLVALTRTRPPHLSTAFARSRPLPNGERAVERSGFWFQIFLPDVHGHGTTKRTEVDAEKAEDHWCCYAWPVRPNSSGKRIFFVDERGVVHWRHNHGTYGSHRTPRFDDAWRTSHRWHPLR